MNGFPFDDMKVGDYFVTDKRGAYEAVKRYERDHPGVLLFIIPEAFRIVRVEEKTRQGLRAVMKKSSHRYCDNSGMVKPAIIEALKRHGKMSVRELADAIDFSVRKTWFTLTHSKFVKNAGGMGYNSVWELV